MAITKISRVAFHKIVLLFAYILKKPSLLGMAFLVLFVALHGKDYFETLIHK